MLLQHNIDRNDAAYNTKSPFRYECPLALPDGVLPAQSILAAVAYCSDDIQQPVRISAISVDPVNAACCIAEFSDSAGNRLGNAYLYKSAPAGYITTFILDSYENINGHVSYKAEAAEAFMQAALMSGGSYITGDNDFRLLPQCHVAVFKQSGRAISVNGDITHCNVAIMPTIEMHTELLSPPDKNAGLTSNSYVLSMAEPYYQGTTLETDPTMNGITKLSMNNLYSIDMTPVQNSDYAIDNPFNLGGVHLVVRSSDTSNIRVISSDRSLTLVGVKDV